MLPHRRCAINHPKADTILESLQDDRDRRELERLSWSVSEPLRVVRQVQVLLSAAGGVANEETARRVGAADTVRARRRGLAAGGLGWLGTVAPGRGPALSP